MNHKRVSNILFGCAVALGFEAYILQAHDILNGAFTLSCIALIVLWQSWVVFNFDEEK